MNKLTALNSIPPNRTSKELKQTLNRFAVWRDGQCTWLDDKRWDITPLYDDKRSNLVFFIAYHHEWQLHITILQEHFEVNDSSLYTFIVKNQSDEQRELRFLMHQMNVIQEPSVSFVSPMNQVILHYGQDSLTLVASKFYNEKESQLSVGRKDMIWNEQAGTLALSPLCQNEQEWMILTSLLLASQQETFGRIWEIHGRSEDAVWEAHEKQCI